MRIKLLYVSLAILGVFTLISCQKDIIELTSDSDSTLGRSVSSVANASAIMHPGRTLAANCFQCHGTNGYGLEHLAGKPASEISDELIDMKKNNPRSAIMNVHAVAFTQSEIDLIADFFSKQ